MKVLFSSEANFYSKPPLCSPVISLCSVLCVCLVCALPLPPSPPKRFPSRWWSSGIRAVATHEPYAFPGVFRPVGGALD